MKFTEWVDRQAKKRKVKKATIINEVSARSELTQQSIRNFYRGMHVGRGESARRLSEATDGKVSVLELMGLDK